LRVGFNFAVNTAKFFAVVGVRDYSSGLGALRFRRYSSGHFFDRERKQRLAGNRSKAGNTISLTANRRSLYLNARTTEALEAISEAHALVERYGERWWGAELYRLRGVFLTTIGAGEAQIEASFRLAIETAREQKSTSLAKRAEATYSEYCRQKGRPLGLHACRLSLLDQNFRQT
jgi:hypothetical protein